MKIVINHEEMKAQAARYRWLKQHAPLHLCAVAWSRSDVACKLPDPDANNPDKAIDAAIADPKPKA